jgi:hypothetical protein
VFLIGNTTTGAVDVLISTSATAPTMTLPNAAGFTKKRRIGSIRTNASSQIVGFIQVGDYFYYTVPIQDYSGTNSGSATSYSVSIPNGVTVMWLGIVVAMNSTNQAGFLVRSPLQTSLPNPYYFGQVTESARLNQLARIWGPALPTASNNSQIIAYGTEAENPFIINTYGWTDNRGK